MEKIDKVGKKIRAGLIFCVLFGASAGGAVAQTPANNYPPPPSSGPVKPDPAPQPLVPESYYAVKLAEALQLPVAGDPAKAEAELSKLGIEPKNGWISEFPLTPAVLGEVDKGVVTASEQEKIGLDKDQALKRVAALKSQLGFAIGREAQNLAAAGRGPTTSVSTIYSYTDNKGGKHFTDDYTSIPPEYQQQTKKMSQTVTTPAYSSPVVGPYAPAPNPAYLTGYYQNQGPPIVTYYTPPPAYNYLYSYNPYPFWYSGYYFPGFYVLNDFHRQLALEGGNFTVSHHAGPGGRHGGGGNLAGEMAAGNLFANPAAETGARNIAGQQRNTQFENPGQQQFNPAIRHSGGFTGGNVNQAGPIGAIQPMQSLNLGTIHQVQPYQPSYMPQAPINPYTPLINQEYQGAPGVQHHQGGGMHGGRR